MSNIGVFQLIVLLALLFIFFFPTIVVFMRNGHNKLSVFLLGADTKPGSGTTFEIDLPLSRVADRAL